MMIVVTSPMGDHAPPLLAAMTITEAKGYYSDSPKTVVYIGENRFQVGKMKELVHENDRSAYISIAEIADVYGANTDKV